MLFDAEQPFALFENQLDKNIECPYQLFFEPIEEIKTYQLQEVSASLQRIQQLSDKAYFLAGYIAYEALANSLDIGSDNGPATTNETSSEASGVATMSTVQPLVHFYAFAKKQDFSAENFAANILPLLSLNKNLMGLKPSPLLLYDFQLNETFASYQNKITKIKEYQRQGDTYQVNFTMKNRFKWQGSAFQFFLELKKYQKVTLAAFFHFDKDICSYSPELFIQKNADVLTAKPMKGTAPRGKDAESDARLIREMREDTKIISENLMIVDLIRNDLGRIALPGTVRVPKLFEVETYATLHQMTSTVQAKIDPALKFEELVEALFPCGSITGAPKQSTMKIICELEAEPRQIYTGALGFILPSGDFVFNVAIRTLILTSAASGYNTGEMGIGSGIIYESDAVKEWDECLLKAKFIKMLNSPIQLIETFCYEANSKSILRLDLHLQRLARSAEQLGFNYSLAKIEAKLNNLYSRLMVESVVNNQKIRLLLFQNGEIQLTYSPVEPTKPIYKVVCCKVPIKKQSLWQKHKTTHRNFYESFLQRALAHGYDEVLFFNEESSCVEASRHNLVIKRGEHYITPPLSDGALPGVFRQMLCTDQNYSLREASFGWHELISATEVYLCNSVRGLVPAEILPHWLEAE